MNRVQQARDHLKLAYWWYIGLAGVILAPGSAIAGEYWMAILSLGLVGLAVFRLRQLRGGGVRG